MSDKSTVNELIRLVEIDKVPPQGFSLTIEAEPDERTAIARRLGLLELPSLRATLTVTRLADGESFGVKGKLEAAVVQECVVSLTPIAAKVDEAVSGLFVPARQLAVGKHEEIDDPLAEIPEAISNGAIDVGELVVQHLALGLDPYPRQAGVAPALPRSVAPSEEKRKPFEGLAALLQNKEKNDKKE